MANGRLKRLAKNTGSSFIYQITTIVCGFIVPKLILSYFGSEVNGLVGSITQFLQIIAFLELGVGAVVQSSLYKPLADKDNIATSKIITSANKFFRKLAHILLVYVVILVFVYPLISDDSFSPMYTALLIISMCISSFAQYYFGIVDRLLLTADQRGYIQYNAQTITLILNTIACAVLIYLGSSIHMVKLTTSLIYVARPLVLRMYVNRHYDINRNIEYDEEPIKQKWNGVSQHIAAVVLDSTDTIVLTMFATLADVSIYGVYNLVVHGVKQLFMSLTNGIQSLLGELWAKQELDELRQTFGWTEWIIHTGVVFFFGCTAVLLVPFIEIYTKGITDANYIQPLFAILITLAQACHCLRLPYNLMILAGGHYKSTQGSYLIAAGINVVVSVLVVSKFGLIGVAVGTLAAMSYQTIYMIHYNSVNFIKWPLLNVCKQIFTDLMIILIAGFISSIFEMNSVNIISWIILAIQVALVWLLVSASINFVLYKDKTNILLNKVKKILNK